MHNPEMHPFTPEETLQEIPEEIHSQFPEVAQAYEALAGDYFELVEENSSLENENAELRDRVAELEAENQKLRKQPLSDEAWEQILAITKSALRNRRSVERHRKIAEEQHSHIHELKEAVEKAENTDPLTGLLNSRGLEQAYDRLGEHNSHKRRNYESSTMLFLDLDKFKLVNDTIGHMVGDEVLKTVAEQLRSRLREDDIIGRKGGDEFVIILPFTSAADSLNLAEDIRELIQGIGSVDGNMLPEEFGVSIGVCRMKFDLSFAGSASLANEAMRAAKQDGRNKVIQCEENTTK